MQKSRFVIFILLISLSFSGQAYTSTNMDFDENNLDKHIKNYQKLIKSMDKERPTELGSLKGQIKSDSIKDAQRLSKALLQRDKGRYEAAISLLKDINKKSLLHDYASYFVARALIHEHEYKKALKALPPLNNPQKKIDLERFWLRMHALALNKKKQALYKEIEALKKQRRKDKWVDIKGAYYKGLADLVDGEKQAAMASFRKVLVDNPGTEYDKIIFEDLRKKGTSRQAALSRAQWNLRAENLIKNGFPHQALSIWHVFYRKNHSYQERVAYGTHRLRDYKESAKLYEQLLHSNNHNLSEVDILAKIAQAYSRSDNFTSAINTYDLILKKYPESGAASLGRFKLGFLYFDSQQYARAAQYFEKFLNKGSKWQRDRANWFRWWSYYLTKNYEQALAELDTMTLGKHKKKADKILLDYWKARIYEKMGLTKDAKKLYQSVAQRDGVDYYGFLARQRLKYGRLHPQTLIDSKVLTIVPKGSRKPGDKRVNLKSFDPADPLIKAILLNHIGLPRFAFDESRYSQYASSIPDYNTAKAFELAGNYNRAYGFRKTAQAGAIAGANLVQGFQLTFPEAYDHFVEGYSEIWGLDPRLAWAVMRQESAFKPEALSYAYAYGLMQIIPPTGDEIAGKIDYPDFHPSLLNNPEVNTLFGTFYLKLLLDKFDNNLIFAIAGYNAGPDAVSRWKVKAPTMEMDEFIELIPFKETNKYVKKVLVNYLIYGRLYP